METKLQDDERSGFSKRLKQILAARAVNASASQFATEFNLRADGLAITSHGARKWLLGESLPTQPRLQILSSWLGVSPAWLRFGDAAMASTSLGDVACPTMTEAEQAFARDVQMLTESNGKLLRQIVTNMLRIQSESTPGRSPLRTRGLTST